MSDIFQVTVCQCQGMGSGGLQRWPLWSWVCHMQNTGASIQLQQSHCRAQLIPSAMYVAPLGNIFKGKVPYGSVRTEKNSVRTRHQGHRRRSGRMCSRSWSGDSLAAHGGHHGGVDIHAADSGEPVLEQPYPEGLQPMEWQARARWAGRNFPEVKSVLPMTITGKGYLCLYVNPWAFLPYFRPPSFWGQGVSGVAGWHLTASQDITTHHTDWGNHRTSVAATSQLPAYHTTGMSCPADARGRHSKQKRPFLQLHTSGDSNCTLLSRSTCFLVLHNE